MFGGCTAAAFDNDTAATAATVAMLHGRGLCLCACTVAESVGLQYMLDGDQRKQPIALFVARYAPESTQALTCAIAFSLPFEPA